MTNPYTPPKDLSALLTSPTTLNTVSPVTGAVVETRTYASDAELEAQLSRSHAAFQAWRNVPLADRLAVLTRFFDLVEEDAHVFAQALVDSMGRPVRWKLAEVSGMVDRGRWLVAHASEALADAHVNAGRPGGFDRIVRKVPMGPALLVGAWNYPYLIQVNALVPALAAGNSVLIKPSPQTPKCGELFALYLAKAGLPADVAQTLHLTPAQMDRVVSHPLVPFISFTGSVENGKKVYANAASASNAGFKTVGLELGGKDAAYVRADADIAFSAENVVEGALFNSGQSCCAIERVYVSEAIYDEFVAAVVSNVKQWTLGDPRDDNTWLGPVVSERSASLIRSHVAQALSKGAKALIDEKEVFPLAKEGTTFVAPQVLVDVDASMDVIAEETFGPIVALVKVKSDEEAIKLLNESKFGLTASVWTKDSAAFDALADEIDTATVFLNRCDYLDPALPWGGRKLSGLGVSLSSHGFDAVTYLKGIHKRL